MKRYEKMSKEEIIEAFATSPFCTGDKCNSNITCIEYGRDWLNEEIETKPRWASIKSNEDLDDMYDNWLENNARCNECEYPDSITCSNCFCCWLKDEVEV